MRSLNWVCRLLTRWIQKPDRDQTSQMWYSIIDMTHLLWVRMVNMVSSTQLQGQHTHCEWEWAGMRSTWFLVLNYRNNALAMSKNGQHCFWCSITGMTHNLWARMGRNEVNMISGAQLKKQHTDCEQEWAGVRSTMTWFLVLNYTDNIPPESENGQKSGQHGVWCSITGTTHPLSVRMGRNEVNMVPGAQLQGQRTFCEQEWAGMRSTWCLVLNYRDNTHPVSENRHEWGQHGVWCSITGTTHILWVRMSRNEVNMVSGAQLQGSPTSCEWEWAGMRSHGFWCSITGMTHILWARMGTNKVNMVSGAQLQGQHTSWEWEWAEMRSTWFLELNYRDNVRAVSKNEQKWGHMVSGAQLQENLHPVSKNGQEYGQHDVWCSITGTTHILWARMSRNEVNMVSGAQLQRQRTGCEQE